MKIFEKYYYLISTVTVFIVYNFTLAPSVIQIDSGELASVQKLLGIAHPTGYPLFTMLGYFFLQLPIFSSDIFQANFLAAIYCSISVGLFSKFLFEIFLISKVNSLPETTIKLIIISSSIVLGLSTTFWFQSTSVEVYSLHLVLIISTLFLFVKAFRNDDAKFWYLFAYFFGISLSNHMTSILIIPAAVYLYFKKNSFNKNSFLFGARLALITAISAMIVYLYLPIRAMQEPILNWGNPIDFERFWRHFTGAQYQVWIFSSLEASKKQLSYFIQNLTNEFFSIIYLPIIFGIVSLFKISKTVLFFTLLLTFSTILYSINYDIVDIDSYFLLTYISFIVFFFFGIIRILEFSKNPTINVILMTIILIIFPALQLTMNHDKVDQSDNFIFEDYTKASLNSLPANSILFSYQWDYLISPSYYFQFVENYRRDVTIVDKELLRRSWYFDQLNNVDNSLLSGLNNEVKSFLDALKPFEQGGNFNPQVLEHYYRLILQKLISENQDRDFFIGVELFSNELQNGEFQLPKDYTIVPYLLSLKVTKETDYVSAPLPDFEFRLPKNANKYTDFIVSTVCNMLQNRAMYELRFEKIERAKIYSERILEISPSFLLNKNLLELIRD